MEALKTATHIQNKVHSKLVPKSPYELWTGRNPTLNYLRMWGCAAKAKIFNPQLNKLDHKTVSCHFIGYAENSKGYHFYCPGGHHTKFVETRYVVFLENAEISRSSQRHEVDLDEIRADFFYLCGRTS